MNENNLNRIKGILSAKNGTLVPKFLEGAKFVKRRRNRLIYSDDGENWFYNQKLTRSFNRNPEKYGDTLEIGTEDTPGFITQNQIDSLNKNRENITQFTGQSLNLIGDIFGASLQVTDSELTKNITTGYDGIANVAENFGPIGQIIGGAMKTLGAIGNISQAMGGGTDQQTKLDSWMDSPLLSWNVGAINGFFGKNTDSFGVDLETLQQVGGSYGGITTSINEAAESADKEYGLFSGKARKKANDVINKAKQLQNSMKNIADLASDQQLVVQSMGEQAGLAYSMMTGGGYDQKYTYAAKKGGIIEYNSLEELKWEPQIELNWELPVFKEGGNVNLIEELKWIPELQKGGKTRTLEELIEYAKKENPRFIQRMSEPLRFIRINFKDEDGNTSWAHATHEMNYKGKDVFSMIQEIDGKLHRFDSEEEAYENAKKTNNILTFDSEEEAKLFAKSGQNENGEYYGYKLGWQDFFNTSPEGLKEEYSINLYKQGGSVKESDIPEIEETNLKNVIPEGALHKNKHHMEHAEGLTKKGIPVIDEEGEQQAEIEHSEIIFTLEITKKLEEYYQIFYSEESSNKEKEQAALDAGKLLVYQILENTEDRTGLIESCKKGGTLTHKISNDSIKEISEWIPNIVIIEKEFEKNPKNKEKSEKDNIKDMIKEVLIEILTNK